jgi:predicted alpha/beta superfamily hydrolase
MDLAKEIKDVIIVAIGDSSQSEYDWHVSRYYDYTPSYVGKMDTTWSYILKFPVGSLKSGGSPAFLSTIQKDIIPFIDMHYKTTKDRGISGHSLGGLFVSYCLLTAPGLFNRYGINSPALWWNNKEILSMEHSFATQRTGLAANIFISVGSLEGEQMVSPMNSFAASLKEHNYKGLILSSQVFDNETHVSVAPASNSRTLRVLYGVRVK